MTMPQSEIGTEARAIAEQIEIVLDQPSTMLSVLTVSGEVDMLTAPLLRTRVLDQLATTSVVVLDLSTVSFFGSAGLAVLVEARRAATAHRSDLRLVAGNRIVTRPMAISGIDQAFRVHSDLDEALTG
ncbi:STAS domain-containing protein [Kutzneria viridogrisea]|uniref:Anti-sigma factor antagonist n=2 Tax=Kutzneria TaxID=43356 RepID=W5WII6_9PSEU|nr:STAS domain-containing protein [Kutzneria albida]AHH97984.1 hypothetical protein KALB_4622 [Kutzneria albida DSM 43870]MBA8924359.1 anti-anti-sigma factor [Kutzneria viridogrisea]